MKLRSLFVFLLSVSALWTFAQSPIADFNVSSEACREELFTATNQSAHASHFEWDFCLNDTETLAQNEQLASISGLTRSFGYKLIQDKGEWFGFATSSNNHSLYRLDFGSSPTNQPAVTNLGNLGGLLQFPEGIDIIRDDDEWFAFVGSLNSNHGIIRIDFGTSLKNASPSCRNLGNFDFATRFRSLKVIKDDMDYVLVLVAYNLNSIVRINYRDSFDNTITSENIYNTGSISGLVNPIGIDVVTNAIGETVMLVASYNGNSVTQLNFGSDILSPPDIDATFSFPEISKPYYVKAVQEGDRFYAVISNETLPVTILNFHDLTSNEPPAVVPHSSLPVGGGIEMFRCDGKTIVQTVGSSNNSLRQLTFESVCGSSIPFYAGAEPPPVSYSTSGKKTIELTASNEVGEKSLASKTLNVTPGQAPDVSFTSTNICALHDVNFFSQTSGDVSSHTWDFGDATASSGPSPVHRYSKAGQYEISLQVVGNNGCKNSYSEVLGIYQKPSAFFDLPEGVICTNNDLAVPNLTVGDYDGNLSYQWFINDNPVSTDRDLQYTFTTTGEKEIRLLTSIPGCSDVLSMMTSRVEAGPMVDFSFNGTCEDDIFTFKQEISDPVESYFWNFGEGSSSLEETPSRQFSAFGDYTVSLTATNAIGCEKTKAKTVTVHSKPLVDFNAATPPNTCSGSATLFQNQTTNADGGEITEWRWDFGDINDRTVSSDKNPMHIFQAPDTYAVTLTATTATKCSNLIQKNVRIYQSPSTAFTHTPVCDDLPVKFKGPADAVIAKAYWEIGTSYYEERSPSHTFRSPGDYPVHLEITDVNGCVATVNKTVSVPVSLAPDFSVSKNCVNEEAILIDITTGVDAVIATEWSVDGKEVASGSPLVYTFTQQESQSVNLKVTTEAGCIYQATKQVPVHVPPAASFSSDKTTGAYPLDVKFINTSTGASQFLWEFLDATATTSSETSPIYTFQNEGTFDVVLTAIDDHYCEATFTATITTIPPLPDADVELITFAQNPDGSMKLIVTIHNKGNTVLQNIPLDVNLSGNVSLRQMLDEPVSPGARYNIVFNTGIISLETQAYVCVDLTLANDLSPEKNRMCRQFRQELLVFPCYPNPAASSLHLEWISAAAGTVGISLIDAVGRSLFRHERMASIGLNHHIMDMTSLENGVYYLVVEEGDKQRRQRIAVAH